MIHVLFVMKNLRIYITFSMNAITPKRSELMSNRTRTIYWISQYKFVQKKFHLEFHVSFIVWFIALI